MPMYWQLKRWKAEDRQRTIDHISALRKHIARAVPRRTASETLLLATWNLRDFDSNKFGQGPRIPESYHYIAEVISCFDLVAMQEVNEDMRPFEKVMELRGPTNFAQKLITTHVHRRLEEFRRPRSTSPASSCSAAEAIRAESRRAATHADASAQFPLRVDPKPAAD